MLDKYTGGNKMKVWSVYSHEKKQSKKDSGRKWKSEKRNDVKNKGDEELSKAEKRMNRDIISFTFKQAWTIISNVLHIKDWRYCTYVLNYTKLLCTCWMRKIFFNTAAWAILFAINWSYIPIYKSSPEDSCLKWSVI